MKKLSFYRFRSRIFKGFLISVSGLVFLTLILVMVLSVRHISSNMRAEEVRILENKLYTVAEDMNDQISNMSRIVMKIAFQDIFSLDYIKANKYHEKEVADIFQGYNSFSDIAGEYFIMYEGYDKLFTSAGTTISPANYFSARQELESCDQILELLDSLCRESKQGLFLYREKDNILFLYPLQVYASSGSGRQGVVGFLASSAEIDRRMERIVGKMHGDMLMYFDGYCIYGDERGQKSRDDFSAYAKVKKIQIYARTDDKSLFSWKNVFSAGEMAAFATIVVLLLLCVYAVTWWNYLPVHKMMKKYAFTVSEGRMLGWDDIDGLIELLLHERETSRHLVERQVRILREQAVGLIASEGYSDHLQNHLALLNIKIDFSVFGIIRTGFQKEHKEGEDEALYQSIEELSGKDFHLYPYWSREGKLQVLIAAEEEYQLDEAAELLQSLFETLGICSDVELSAKCRDINSLHLLNGTAEKEKGEADSTGPDKNEGKRNTGKQKNTAKQVVEYINAHCTDYHISLDMIARELQLTPPYLCTILKQEIGMSYKEYLTKLRMEEAKRLLTEEYISVADICQRVGYASASYFIKLFQKYTGMTPTRYRTEYQTEHQREE